VTRPFGETEYRFSYQVFRRREPALGNVL